MAQCNKHKLSDGRSGFCANCLALFPRESAYWESVGRMAWLRGYGALGGAYSMWSDELRGLH